MLKPLIAKLKYKNIFAFDIETYSDKNYFMMGSVYGKYTNENSYTKTIDKVFWNKKDMVDYFINNRYFYENSYIVATNLGFDFFGLFENTDVLGRFNLIIRGSNLITSKLQHETRKKTESFIDTINFSKISVKQMGNLLGIPKLPQPICFKRMPKDEDEFIEMQNYNKRDTYITYKFTELLQNTFNDLGCTMKTTIASTSMDLFKRKYLKQPLIQNKKSIPTLYKAYYGARVETIKRGYIKDCNYYDFNSLYSSVMLKNYPNPNTEKYSIKCNRHLINRYEGIAKVSMYIKNIDLPYLPYRQQINKSGAYKLIFPKGFIEGYYTFYEIREAIKLGYQLVDIGEGIYYTETFKPFENYVKDLYKKRLYYKKDKDVREQVVKLLLNSLYGKFAQHIDNKEEIFHLDYLDDKTFNEYVNNSNLYKSIVRGNYIYVTKKIEPYISSFIIPIFSIYVTAYGRDKLYKKIREIGIKNVYYYDTDSIITNKTTSHSKQLGDLDLEYEVNDGLLISPKMYYLSTKNCGDIIKIKGIPHLRNKQDFLNLIQTRKNIYEKFVKFKEANARNLKYNEIIEIEKNINLEDTKRVWNKKFSINELQKSISIVI